MKAQPDDRRVHLRRRPERARRQRQQRARRRRACRSGRSARRSPRCRARRPAGRRPRAAASACASASGTPARVQLDQLEQDRRRDVVGQVAGDADAARSAVAARQSRRVGRRRENRRRRRSRCAGAARRSSAARSRSISKATTRLRARGERAGQRAAAGADLEERVVRPAARSRATTLSTHAGSRKCWPNRFRAADRSLAARPRRRSSPSPRQYVSSISSISSSLMPK